LWLWFRQIVDDFQETPQTYLNFAEETIAVLPSAKAYVQQFDVSFAQV